VVERQQGEGRGTMTAAHIIGIDVVIDDTMRALGHTSHRLAGVADAEAPVRW